jgi:quercetin dioxygenase-like cupin family protein
MRRHEQDVVVDPSGWERRILSPVLAGVEFELMRTTIGPGVEAGAFAPHGFGSREYVAVETGTLVLTLDGRPSTLEAGDSISFDGDCVHAFSNPGAEPCVYYLAMDVSGGGRAHHRRLATTGREAG